MSKKNTKRKYGGLKWGGLAVVIIAIVAAITGATVNINMDAQNYGATIQYSEDQQPALVEDDKGEIVEEDSIPTVEEVDGGRFEDAFTGVSLVEGDYEDLGWAEWYPTDTPEAFRNATIGKCVYANNKWGAQCVSLSRSFWFSYAGRDVSTCGTGMAKGMMNCAAQNAGNDFDIYWKDSANKIQAGDWLVFDGGQFGHVGMALGPVTNGYVALLGVNQGGKACEGGGAATNIINISIKNLIGFYRPKAYIKPEPKPTPTPTPAPTPAPSKTVTYTYVKGDYFSKVLKKLGLDEGHLWGKNGTVAYYTQQLVEQKVLDSRGNVKIGVPFTLTRR